MNPWTIVLAVAGVLLNVLGLLAVTVAPDLPQGLGTVGLQLLGLSALLAGIGWQLRRTGP